MPYKVKVVQNKIRNEKKQTKELRELRGENQKLRKENARLRKELNRKLSSELYDETDVSTLASVEGLVKAVCPKCSSDSLTTIDFGVKIITVCKSCKWRKSLDDNRK